MPARIFRTLALTTGLLAIAALNPSGLVSSPAAAQSPATAVNETHYRSAEIDGVELAYREAGPKMPRRCCCCTAFPPRRACSAI